jgi:hypothetical protein
MKPLFLPAAAMLSGFLLFAPPAMAERSSVANHTEEKLMVTDAFLSGHPDLRFRLLALQRREQGKLEDAFKFFQRAAFYGDKPSQGMVGEMLWTGAGTAIDKPQAYVWMDLAAERGYEGFLELRERYWALLDASERERAIAIGQDLYARYGDEATQPRIDRALRLERRNMVGSRTGFTANVRVIVPGPAGPEEIDGSKFYDERYWDPKQYRAWHDAVWMKPRVAKVDIGDVTQVPQTELGSRIPYVEPALDAEEPDTEDLMPPVDGNPAPR